MAANVVLFKKNKGLVSRCISLVTGSDITHSGILFEGQLYDASERRGKFGSAKLRRLKDRKVEVYNLGASEAQVDSWLIRHNGKEYDYAGVLQWALFYVFGRFVNRLKLSSKDKVYCFEATAALIGTVSGIKKFPNNLHGDHLKRTLGKPVYVGKLKEFLEYAD